MKTEGLLRFDYASIKKKFVKLRKGSVRLTQSTLFLIQQIDPTKAAYQFPVLENDTSNGGIDKNEIRLNQNDEFISTSMGLFLLAQKFTGEVAAPALVGGLKLFTYAPVEQNTALDTLTPLYDGFMRIAVNNIVFVDKWATRKHEKVQRTQLSSQAAVALNGATFPSFEGDSDGMVVEAPTVTLSGAKKNDISLILPVAISKGTYAFTDNAGVTSTWIIKSVGVRMEGLLAQNSAAFQTASLPRR